MSPLPSHSDQPSSRQHQTQSAHDKKAEIYEAIGRAFFKELGDEIPEDLPELQLTDEERQEAERFAQQTAEALRAMAGQTNVQVTGQHHRT